jgi:hypothetical protein
VSLPLRHFTFASLAFLFFSVGLIWGGGHLVGFDVNARLALGLTHLMTLGWLAQTIMGAWTQMIPSHGRVALVSLRGVTISWWIFSFGIIVFISQLLSGGNRYWFGAGLAATGVYAELFVIGWTQARAAKRDWAATHFIAAMCWLACLAAVGVAMSWDRQRGLIFRDPEGGLIAHVHMAFIGFALMTVYGAGYRLIPWISIRQMTSRWEGRTCFVLTNLALLGLSMDALFFGRKLMPVWACAISLGFLFYAIQLREVFVLRRRVDYSSGFIYLWLMGTFVWGLIGLGLAFGLFSDVIPARMAYIFAALVGSFTPIILVQIHKIVPFLVWLHLYGPQAEPQHGPVPSAETLTRSSLVWVVLTACSCALPLGLAGLILEHPALVRFSGAASTTASRRTSAPRWRGWPARSTAAPAPPTSASRAAARLPAASQSPRAAR